MSLNYAREAGRVEQVVSMRGGKFHLNVDVNHSAKYFVIENVPDTKSPHFFGEVFNLLVSVNLNYNQLFLLGREKKPFF